MLFSPGSLESHILRKGIAVILVETDIQTVPRDRKLAFCQRAPICQACESGKLEQVLQPHSSFQMALVALTNGLKTSPGQILSHNQQAEPNVQNSLSRGDLQVWCLSNYVNPSKISQDNPNICKRIILAETSSAWTERHRDRTE